MTKSTIVLTQPHPDTLVDPRTYSEDQQAQIQSLREYATSISLPTSDPYFVWEQRWLNKPDTISRYMRASKWRLDDAKKRIKNTLEWRREFKPDLIPPDEVKIEAESGKIIFNGFDKDGRPILYLRPGRENTPQSLRQLRHLVWWLERAKDLSPSHQDTITIVVDYASTTLRTNPSLSVARKVLTILQHHYVETLGRGLVVNLPGILAFFYKGLSPFMDPVTRDKIRFNPDLTELIPVEHLDVAFGGQYELEYDFEEYWRQVVEACGIATDGTRLREHPQAPLSADSYQPATSENETEKDVTRPSDEMQISSRAHTRSESEASSETDVAVPSILVVGMDKLAIEQQLDRDLERERTDQARVSVL